MSATVAAALKRIPDPPALAYANQASGNDAPAVGYSTVYPLTMFLRILAGQMILLTMM